MCWSPPPFFTSFRMASFTPYYFVPLALILGVTLNGSSSVLYSLAASFFKLENRTRGYALFYTIYLLSGAVGPVVYGLLGDALGIYAIFISLSIATLFTIPVILVYVRSKHISLKSS